jgi:RNA polymerase sigma-70 factor (ECF subfamily)
MRPQLAKAIELLQNNTPEAVDEALGLLQNTVYSFSMKVCGHPEDAEDTMQEVLFRSLKHLRKIHDPRALSVWLYTVTRNRCWRMRRKPVNQSGRHVSLDELMPDDSELAALLEEEGLSPEGTAMQVEKQAVLQQTVLRLPVALRLVLVLHDMEDLTSEEVAQVLGLQTGTVRVRLHRARLAVRKDMSRRMQEHGTVKAETPSRKRAVATRSVAKKRPAECRDLFAQLSDYVDGRVEPTACAEMERHIAACPACVAFLGDLRRAIERCRQMDVPCDPAVAKRLRAAFTREYLRLVAAPQPQEFPASYVMKTMKEVSVRVKGQNIHGSQSQSDRSIQVQSRSKIAQRHLRPAAR